MAVTAKVEILFRDVCVLTKTSENTFGKQFVKNIQGTSDLTLTLTMKAESMIIQEVADQGLLPGL